MKTVHSQVHPHEHGAGSLANGLGKQLAAALLAVVVAPAAFHAVDTHSEPVAPIKRSAVSGPRS